MAGTLYAWAGKGRMEGDGGRKREAAPALPFSRSLFLQIRKALPPDRHGASGARVALLCQLPTSPPDPQIAVRIVPHAA